MKGSKRLWRAFLSHLDIPAEALPSGFGLTLSGQSELTVRGCHRILHYGEEAIWLDVGRVALCIEGKGLLCAALSGGGVTVKGTIEMLCFREVGK